MADEQIEQVAIQTPAGPVSVEDSKINDHPKEPETTAVYRGPSISTTEASDTGSTNSLPAVNIIAPESPPANGPSPAPQNDIPPPSPSRSAITTSRLAPEERRNRHRSAIEPRSSNRLSGFFTNFMHRRDNVSPSPSSTLNPGSQTIGSSADKPSSSTTPSRSSSPPPRPVTPPPSLPAPSLQELGLSLSVITSDLAPSHFSTPPASGAFMAPHYLLLCHAQGLDVLPLISPPQPQPYALVRRVSFKSVVVMEQRGVLVAIAGRRDGVRVYALEEVRKAIEWRMEVEVRRERDRARRDNSKKNAMSMILDGVDRPSQEKLRKGSLPSPSTLGESARAKLPRKNSQPTLPTPSTPLPSTPEALIPRTPTTGPLPQSKPEGLPPPYDPPPVPSSSYLQPQPSLSDLRGRQRTNSVADMLSAAPMSRRATETSRSRDPDSKADWAESSEEEAIDIVAAGSSGSQALDERTSVRLSASITQPSILTPPSPPRQSTSRRPRPSNLDLSLTRSSIEPPEPSPAPTLHTLRQTLSHSPPTREGRVGSSDGDGEDEETDAGQISLAQALFESRIPDLPPPGTRRAQHPILITSSHPIATGENEDESSSPRTSETHTDPNAAPNPPKEPNVRRRRRWSVLIGQSSPTPEPEVSPVPPNTAPASRERTPNLLSRSHSYRSTQSSTTVRQASVVGEPITSSPTAQTALPTEVSTTPSIHSTQSSRSSRFIPRIISNAFQNRRSEDHSSPVRRNTDSDATKKGNSTPISNQYPPPKLEYVKLPGTKGALMIKAVETAKKSFLAILCGDNGEKVELFAGTYRTALGLSRTFILPDSPRSLELQLQGDDLVEVFLVFSQNVFGLEPATVRVREVRIGRAERRAARRRGRERRDGPNDSEPPLGEDDTNVNVSIGVTVAVGSTVVASGTGEPTSASPLVASHHPDQPTDQPADFEDGAIERSTTPVDSSVSALQTEELVAIATAQMGPYTTFQQLSFAPNFPIASIADDYVIPPTYPEFIEYRGVHEADGESSNASDLTQAQFSPPGLPVPTPTAPSRWLYKDPKGNVHGPWKASLMQAWYRDGSLPPDLPVRREEDSEYVLLKELRQQCVDPTHPFRPPVPSPSDPSPPPIFEPSNKPLLKPISLLVQPRHYGPPALFFSSRGGHSTTIVDAKGRSVLKGRFVWSEEDEDEEVRSHGRMGDVKRLEAFDVKDRSVLVAMRQGGLEAVDLSDALLKPADESRTVLPLFHPLPSALSRRGPFVWKIGMPVTSSSSSLSLLTPKAKTTTNIPHKKMSGGPGRSPMARSEFNIPDDGDSNRDEVLFLGRKGDEIYMCERNQGSFRILRLCPAS